MTSVMIASIILLFLYSIWDAYIIRQFKKIVDAHNKRVDSDIKTLHRNQKMLHSDLKELKNQIERYEKIQKGNKATTIRPRTGR